MKKTVSILLSLALVLSLFPMHVFAADEVPATNSTRTDFEDGSYCITTITEEESEMQTYATSSSKTGTKSSRFYNSNGELQFTVLVKGTFTYNGSTATATYANYGYSISNTDWTFSSGKASRSGATATAQCTFRLTALYSKTLSVSLTCSPSGVLS